MLTNPSVLKVLHAGGEDLQVFEALCRALPRPVFDTQIAAAFAGLGASLSYRALVENVTGVVLAKDQTRSDWLARPLSAEQCTYASLDVVHIVAIYRALSAQLEARGYTDWCMEETARLMEPSSVYPSVKELFEKLKGASRLDAVAQHRLLALVHWREHSARSRSVPRNHVLRDGGLADLAKRPRLTLEKVRAAELLHPAALRKFGESLVHTLTEFETTRKQADNAMQLLLQPLNKERVTANMPALQAALAQRADALDLPATLLARKRDLEALANDVNSSDATLVLTGWRAAAVGQRLKDTLGDST